MEEANPSNPAVREADRLTALESFDVLGNEAEQDLDDIVKLAAHICATPIATVGFVDGTRQCFKAKVGLAVDEIPRGTAFCAYSIQQDELLVVEDARLDPRFADSPLVTGPPHVCFYAGHPLTTSEGHMLGTLAVMDHQPRELLQHQRFALATLARQVMKWLELRRNVQQLAATVTERDQARQRLEQANVTLGQRIETQSVALSQAVAQQQKLESLYRTLWETTTDTVLIIDTASTIRFANRGTHDRFQYTPAQLVGQPLALVQPERLRMRHEIGLRNYLRTGARTLDWRSTEAVGLRRDGTEVPVEISFSAIHLGGEPLFVGFFRNIAERKQSERVLFEQTEQAQAILRSIADGVIVLDESGRITFMNPLAETLTGWTSAEACGLDHDEVLSFVDPDGARLLFQGQNPQDSDAPMPLFGTPIHIRRRDGSTLTIEGSVARVRGVSGDGAGSVIAFRDVTTWRTMAAQLSYQATHDSLTGLVNRNEFERRLRATIGTAANNPDATGTTHSLLYLDLDQFKVVNDTCGHIAGDELLKQLASLLRVQLRSSDTLARLGGDEFGVLLEQCPSRRAVEIAEKLRKAVAEFSFGWEGRLFDVGVSIGHVSFSGEGMSMTEILSKADEACYMAKDNGRNRLHTYQPGDEDFARRHGEMEWIGLIRQALKDDCFVLHAQEIVSLREHAPGSFVEVLLRMRGSDGELIPPMAFIPAAERYNLMPALDRWVIGTVCARLGARGPAACAQGVCVAVNLSGASVGDPGLADYIRGQLAAHGVSGNGICFEITETAAVSNLSEAARLMQELRTLGCRFALDDFGSGMSSFAYLKHLPVDYLKIDGSFVRNIADDPIDHAMVAAIHHIGHRMGLSTTAEFVENDRIPGGLRASGIDYAQGYGFAMPGPGCRNRSRKTGTRDMATSLHDGHPGRSSGRLDLALEIPAATCPRAASARQHQRRRRHVPPTRLESADLGEDQHAHVFLRIHECDAHVLEAHVREQADHLRHIHGRRFLGELLKHQQPLGGGANALFGDLGPVVDGNLQRVARPSDLCEEVKRSPLEDQVVSFR